MRSKRKLIGALRESLQSKDLPINLAAGDAVFSLNADTALRAHRFGTFVQRCGSRLASANPPVRAVLCAVVFESVLTIQDLHALLVATPDRLRFRGGARVSWHSRSGDVGRVEMRCLSSRTELSLQQAGSDVDWAIAIQAAEQHLADIYPEQASHKKAPTLDQVLLDSSAWHFFHIPKCLYSNLRGALTMPSLSDSVMDRLGSAYQSFDDSVIDVGCVLPVAIHETDLVQEDAMDRLLDLPSNDSPRIPIKTINLLKSICSVSSENGGVRLASHLAQASTKTKLTLAASLIQNEGWVAATLAAWTMHLLTFGSVRKQNPTVSTLSVYLSDLLDPLAATLVRINKPPALMQQDDWTRLFESLAQSNSESSRSAALASLHVWAIRNFGCDPMPHVLFSKGGVPQGIRANVIRPYEQALALQRAATCSLDERVNAQCLTLLVLGCTGLFRIGELHTLTTDDVRQTPEGVRIELDPGRGFHGGKSRSARRVVFLDEAEAVQHVLEFRDRREMESGFEPGAPTFLFGDPNQPKKLYRFGHCVRLINDHLKDCTGDDSVSFHTLRHTRASDRCFKLLTEPSQASAIAPLHLLMHEIGHASAATLWNTYFHFPEFALRAAVDRVDAVKQIRSTEAGLWLGELPSTLRQQRHRVSDELASDFYLRLLNHKVFGPQDASYHLGRPFSLPRVKGPFATAPVPVEYQWVMTALNAIALGLEPTAICSRLSCTPAVLKQLCLATRNALRVLRSNRHARGSTQLLDAADVDHGVRWVRTHLHDLNWSFPSRSTSALHALRNHLQTHAAEYREAAESWSSIYLRQALSLDDPLAAMPFLEILRAAGFPTQGLVIRVQTVSTGSTGGQSEERLHSDIDELKALCLEALHADVRLERVRVRRGFPQRYLMLGRRALSGDAAAPSAGFCMRQIHGLFFALLIFHTYRNGNK